MIRTKAPYHLDPTAIMAIETLESPFKGLDGHDHHDVGYSAPSLEIPTWGHR
jgi:hypothetical protein